MLSYLLTEIIDTSNGIILRSNMRGISCKNIGTASPRPSFMHFLIFALIKKAIGRKIPEIKKKINTSLVSNHLFLNEIHLIKNNFLTFTVWA